jgi:hypothetical protein
MHAADLFFFLFFFADLENLISENSDFTIKIPLRPIRHVSFVVMKKMAGTRWYGVECACPSLEKHASPLEPEFIRCCFLTNVSV